MPKIYTEEEKIDIRIRLHKAAASCMKLYGVKKTTVDELVRRVKIPKGTFYLFYRFKELLLFEVIMEFHEQIEQEMMIDLQMLRQNISVDSLTDVILKFYLKAEDSYILRLMTTDDMQILMEKLPPEVLREHLLHDEDHTAKIIELFAQGKTIDVEAISGGFRAVFFSMLYKEQLGNDFKKSLRTLIRGLVIQILDT